WTEAGVDLAPDCLPACWPRAANGARRIAKQASASASFTVFSQFARGQIVFSIFVFERLWDIDFATEPQRHRGIRRENVSRSSLFLPLWLCDSVAGSSRQRQ